MALPPLSSGPALWAAPLSLPRLQQALEALSAGGEIRNCKTGEYGTVSPEYLASIMSAIHLGVRHAHALQLFPDPTLSLAEALTTADLRPILGVLPELAERGAILAQHARPDSAAAFVRKALVSIAFLTKSGGAREPRMCILPAWTPLYDAAQQRGRATSRKGRAQALLTLQRLGISHDCTTPMGLPEDRAVLVQWGLDAGYAPQTMDVTISAYTHALKALPSTEQRGYPVYPRVRMCTERHLGMLPDVVERARNAGSTASVVEIRDMPPLALLGLLAPGIAEDVEDYLALPRRRALGRDATKSVINACSRFVAAAIRLNEDHAKAFRSGDARMLYFLETMVTVDVQEAQAARPLSRGLQARGSGGAVITQVPLLMAVLDQEAVAARKNSPIQTAHQQSHYPVSVMDSAKQLWRVIEHLYGALSDSEPAVWETLTLRYERVLDRLNHRAPGTPRGARRQKPVAINAKDKRLAIRTITLPQLVCIGLPVLGHHVDALRVRYDAVRTRAQSQGHTDAHPLVRSARRDWHDWLTRYVVLALATDDGLRLANYSYGRLGSFTEMQPTISRSLDGALELLALSTRFTGTGGSQPEARLKMLERPGSEKERERERRVSPGVVRMNLLRDYLLGPRAANLLFQELTDRRGQVVTADTYSLEAELAGEYGGPFAFFVSKRSPRADKAYNKNRASEEFGKALHWVARHALGRELPDYEAIDMHSPYRSIFSIHISRLFIATYWLGVRTDLGREGIDRAMHLTDDTEKALREDYDAVDDVIREARRVYVYASADRWQHPEAYNGFMDRLYALEVIDWAREMDLPRPEHLGTDLIAPVTRAVLQQRVPLRRSRTTRAV